MKVSPVFEVVVLASLVTIVLLMIAKIKFGWPHREFDWLKRHGEIALVVAVVTVAGLVLTGGILFLIRTGLLPNH